MPIVYSGNGIVQGAIWLCRGKSGSDTCLQELRMLVSRIEHWPSRIRKDTNDQRHNNARDEPLCHDKLERGVVQSGTGAEVREQMLAGGGGG